MFDLEMIDFEKIIAIIKDAAALFLDRTAASHITEKGLYDYVTEVDTGVQNLLYRELGALYPDIQFIGEEKDNHAIDFSRPVWIVDPVDGTTNLIHRFQASCISVGLAADHEVIAGFVYNPYFDEFFTARKGMGAFLNGEPIHVSIASALSESLVSIGTAPYQKELADIIFRQIQNVYLRTQDIRRIGSAAIDLCYVACGRDEAFFEHMLKPWDYAAGMLIVAEAGGRVSDYDGNPVFPDRPRGIVATNGRIHEELITVMKAAE